MRRAYSLLEWVIVLSAALAAIAMVRTTLKRQLVNKISQSSDLILWGGWRHDPAVTGGHEADSWDLNNIGVRQATPINNPDLFHTNEKNTQAKAVTNQSQRQETREDIDGAINYDSAQTRTMRTASAGTSDDQAYLLTNRTLNDFSFNMDPSGD